MARQHQGRAIAKVRAKPRAGADGMVDLAFTGIRMAEWNMDAPARERGDEPGAAGQLRREGDEADAAGGGILQAGEIRLRGRAHGAGGVRAPVAGRGTQPRPLKMIAKDGSRKNGVGGAMALDAGELEGQALDVVRDKRKENGGNPAGAKGVDGAAQLRRGNIRPLEINPGKAVDLEVEKSGGRLVWCQGHARGIMQYGSGCDGDGCGGFPHFFEALEFKAIHPAEPLVATGFFH